MKFLKSLFPLKLVLVELFLNQNQSQNLNPNQNLQKRNQHHLKRNINLDQGNKLYTIIMSRLLHNSVQFKRNFR